MVGFPFALQHLAKSHSEPIPLTVKSSGRSQTHSSSVSIIFTLRWSLEEQNSFLEVLFSPEEKVEQMEK